MLKGENVKTEVLKMQGYKRMLEANLLSLKATYVIQSERLHLKSLPKNNKSSKHHEQ